MSGLPSKNFTHYEFIFKTTWKNSKVLNFLDVIKRPILSKVIVLAKKSLVKIMIYVLYFHFPPYSERKKEVKGKTKMMYIVILLRG